MKEGLYLEECAWQAASFHQGLGALYTAPRGSQNWKMLPHPSPGGVEAVAELAQALCFPPLYQSSHCSDPQVEWPESLRTLATPPPKDSLDIPFSWFGDSCPCQQGEECEKLRTPLSFLMPVKSFRDCLVSLKSQTTLCNRLLYIIWESPKSHEAQRG